MKVSRNFVKVFLALFVLVILANIITPFFRLWNTNYLLALCSFVMVLFFLIYRKKDNGTIKFFKFLVLLVPIIIIGFILYSNFIASQEFVYFYDIGSEQDAAKPFLSPLNRISDVEINESYRNMTSQLVYFDSLVPRGSNSITVQTRLFIPSENYTISLGAKNKEEWNYLNKPVYNSLLDNLNISQEITRLNPEMPEINAIDEIPSGAVIATDKDINSKPKQQEFELESFETTRYLRDSHTFYVYLNDSLDLYVEKQDINWYEGEDILNISLKDLEENILGNALIQDDGIAIKNGTIMPVMNTSLQVQNLEQGVYILELQGNSDTIITKLKLNTHKIVSKRRIHSAESANYLLDEDKEVRLFTNLSKKGMITLATWHQPYLQDVLIGTKNITLEISGEYKNSILEEGSYNITIPKSNVIVESSSYLTFSEENYFEPFEFIISKIPSKQEDLIGIDYIITDYKSSKQEDSWRILETTFEMKDLYIKDGKLSLMFSMPHLAESNNETNQDFVKIDWINIIIKKDGIL